MFSKSHLANNGSTFSLKTELNSLRICNLLAFFRNRSLNCDKKNAAFNISTSNWIFCVHWLPTAFYFFTKYQNKLLRIRNSNLNYCDTETGVINLVMKYCDLKWTPDNCFCVSHAYQDATNKCFCHSHKFIEPMTAALLAYSAYASRFLTIFY